MGKLISFLLVIFLAACSADNFVPSPSQQATPIPTSTPEMPPQATEVINISRLEVVLDIQNQGNNNQEWFAWAAQSFGVALDGSCWIADKNHNPSRLLKFGPAGDLLLEIPLLGKVKWVSDIAITASSIWVLDGIAQPPQVLQLSLDGVQQDEFPAPPAAYQIKPGSNTYFQGFTLSKDGRLLVYNEGGSAQFLNAAGEVDWQPWVNERVVEMIPAQYYAPDGSLYQVTFNEPGEPGAGGLIQHYTSEVGEYLGEADLPTSTINAIHFLTIGMDNQVYVIVGNDDHSVQIVRVVLSGR